MARRRQYAHAHYLAVEIPAGPAAPRPDATEAVLSLSRKRRQKPFDDEEIERLEQLARLAGPILHRRRHALESLRLDRESELFRRRALARRQGNLQRHSVPLRLAAPRSHWTARVALGICCLSTLLILPIVGSRDIASARAIVHTNPAGSMVSAVRGLPVVEALLPATYRALLQPGMELTLELDGFRGSRQRPRIAQVESQSGAEPMILVRAELPKVTFESQGRTYPYSDGMTGVARLRVPKRQLLLDWWRKGG